MDKATAIRLLGGTVTEAAKAIGVTSSAVTQWPDDLPARIEDRVLAAYARRHPRFLKLIDGAEPKSSPEIGVDTPHGVKG